MLVSLEPEADLRAVESALVREGLWVDRLESPVGSAFLVREGSAAVRPERLLAIRGVRDVAVRPSAHPRVDTLTGTVVEVHRVPIGVGAPPVLALGPCAVESEAQVHAVARRVAALGARLLRGGAYKPRTSPYSFSGAREAGLRWLREAADDQGLLVVTEVLAPDDAELVARHADLLQIGSRSMQNFPLLHATARQGKPVLLKRGLAATVEEWLLAGEHCLAHGAPGVVFCERGVRSFDGSTRNLLDLGAVALMATVHRLPVLVDPSHAAGRRDLVAPLARAALSAGAAGLLIETHDDPGTARSDGPQALRPRELEELVRGLTT